MLIIDSIVSKAAVINEASRLSEIEKLLYDVSIDEFTQRAEVAAPELIEAIREGRGSSLDALTILLQDFNSHFQDLGSTLVPFYQTASEEAYRIGFEVIWKKANGVYAIEQDITYPSPHRFRAVSNEWLEREKAIIIDPGTPAFNVIDQEAIETLKNHQAFWIGTHYDEVLSDTIANTVVDAMVESGFDREEGAKLVQEKLEHLLGERPGLLSVETLIPHGWKGSIAQYYEGLAANTMTVSRTFGALSAMSRLGVQTYTISNPMDERTCDVCAFLNGTTFLVEPAYARMNTILAASDPAIVKELAPWDTLKTIQAKTGVEVAGPEATLAASAALQDNGYGMPPFHFRCRCVADIGEESFGVPETL